MIYANTFSFINQVLRFGFIWMFCVQIYFINVWLVFVFSLIMHLFFQILSLLLLIFCMDDLEYMASFYCLILFSLTISSKLIIYTLHCILLSISLSHTLKAFVPYGYVVILSNVYSFFIIITI